MEADRGLLTLPNAVTLVRLACVPVFVLLLLDAHARYGAGLLLGVLGITDWVDGYLARHLHQVSTTGKILDPIADRLLLIVGIAAIVYDGDAPVWLAALALGRELVVAVATIILAALGARRVDVSWFGKAGTFGLMVAFPLFLIGHSDAGWRVQAGDMAWVAALPGLCLAVWALIVYVPIARRALDEGRAARRAVLP